MDSRILAARTLREGAIDLASTTVFRILNGDGDGVPGLYVDRFGDWAVSREPREKSEAVRSKVYADLIDAWGLRGVYEKGFLRRLLAAGCPQPLSTLRLSTRPLIPAR